MSNQHIFLPVVVHNFKLDIFTSVIVCVLKIKLEADNYDYFV